MKTKTVKGLKTNEIIVITVGKAELFNNSGDTFDDRNGLWHASGYMHVADLEGEFVRSLNVLSPVHSGLVKTENEAHWAAMEQARAIQTGIRAIGYEVYLVDEYNKNNWDDDHLYGYLKDRANQVERKARADELKAQAHQLLKEAAGLLA
jgi:hypothetical protein